MKIVIDIPDEDIDAIRYLQKNGFASRHELAILKGTILPKGHGDLIDKEKLKANINGWYAFMKDICKQPYMTLKQEDIIGKIDMMTPVIDADKESEE